ncbi:hypothetical protein OG320_18735 [Microbispora sp. NBC_01189]|uniref:hypothetical protein n=1 Tax=Microbispora sp. NBC_01189 TaxID=2903583 RepID=UPI002E0DF551|nr:hypothetical protein OG320_18735 [Microbispora sp. NBC_01189]
MAETTYTSHNPAEEAVPTTKVKEWAAAARVELGQWLRAAKLSSETGTAAEEVLKRLGALEDHPEFHRQGPHGGPEGDQDAGRAGHGGRRAGRPRHGADLHRNERRVPQTIGARRV